MMKNEKAGNKITLRQINKILISYATISLEYTYYYLHILYKKLTT